MRIVKGAQMQQNFYPLSQILSQNIESDSTVYNLTCKMMPAVPTMTAIEKIHKKSLKKFGVTLTSILMTISYYFVNLK